MKTERKFFNQAPIWSDRLYVQVNRKDIAYLRFLLESHSHLALMSVVDKYGAVVQFRFVPENRPELLDLLKGISDQIFLKILDIPFPSDP